MIQWLALLVSGLVLVVSYSQWRTNNQKVVVDLFDRRLKVLTAIEDTIGAITREGAVTNDVFWAFAKAQMDARFLFGDDVSEYLQRLREDIAWMTSYTDAVIDQSPERAALIDKKFKLFERVQGFYNAAPQLFGPYIRLTQKVTPFWRPW